MDSSLGSLLTSLLSAGTELQGVLLVIIIYLLYRQFELHASERQEWNRRYDVLVKLQLEVLERNSKAMQAVQCGMSDVANVLRSEIEILPKGYDSERDRAAGRS